MHTVILMPIANQISDGQIQVQTTLAPVTQYSDGQPQAPKIGSPATSAVPVESTIAASPPPASPISSVTLESAASAPSTSRHSSKPSISAPTSTSDSTSGNQLVACEGGLSLKLSDNKLTDQQGRTGYIASNYQLQFDSPAQAGALFTSGFSVCDDGALILGGSKVFYQCLSGNFYNLYDRKWAAQCNPVTIRTYKLVAC